MGATEGDALAHAAVASTAGKYAVQPADRDKLVLLEDGTLLIASSYATDMAVLAFIELLRKERVPFRRQLATVADVQARYAAASRTPQGATPASTKGASRDAATHRQRDVVELIARAVRMRASDIHFRNFAQTTEVWMRIDGDMRRVDELRSEDGRELCSTIYLLVELVKGGRVVAREPLDVVRDRHATARANLPLSATQLSRGEAVIPTEYVQLPA